MSAGIASPAELSTECFVYELAPGQGARYDELHRDVWPEVLQSLRQSGITDYSIYRRGDLVISVWTRDLAAPTPTLAPDIRQKVMEWNALTDALLTAYEDENGQPLFAERVFSLRAES